MHICTKNLFLLLFMYAALVSCKKDDNISNAKFDKNNFEVSVTETKQLGDNVYIYFDVKNKSNIDYELMANGTLVAYKIRFKVISTDGSQYQAHDVPLPTISANSTAGGLATQAQMNGKTYQSNSFEIIN